VEGRQLNRVRQEKGVINTNNSPERICQVAGNTNHAIATSIEVQQLLPQFRGNRFAASQAVDVSTPTDKQDRAIGMDAADSRQVPEKRLAPQNDGIEGSLLPINCLKLAIYVCLGIGTNPKVRREVSLNPPQFWVLH
jgi:hypothetical protein